MHPYTIGKLGRIRRHEIDEEFKHIHVYRSKKANQFNLTGKVLKRFFGLLASAGQAVKKYITTPRSASKSKD